MADPSWPLRHPWQFLREGRATRMHGAHDVPDDEHERVLNRIRARLDESDWQPGRGFEVTGMGARRTFDGWAYTVAISPWTEQAADEVRRQCEPTPGDRDRDPRAGQLIVEHGRAWPTERERYVSALDLSSEVVGGTSVAGSRATRPQPRGERGVH